MLFSLDIIDWHASAPGIGDRSDWINWSLNDSPIDAAAAQTKLKTLPLMAARRLSSGSRLAVECAMTLLQRHAIDAVVFTSRHGELERNFNIMQALATQQEVSPTDFALSVHNSAVGSLTIMAKQPLVSSSLSAGKDSFQQGMVEVLCLLQAGYQRILMVDFEGQLPEFYRPVVPAGTVSWAYALALVIEAGKGLYCCQTTLSEDQTLSLPQSLQFLRGWLKAEASFCVAGEQTCWQWSRV
ncbi:MAG: beta-ketoacyl synthase chain length factor [Enterobacteriaceae bacterium]